MGSNADEGIAQLCTSLLILNVSEVVLTINFRVNFRLCRLFDNSTTMMLYSDRVSSFSQDFKIFFSLASRSSFQLYALTWCGCYSCRRRFCRCYCLKSCCCFMCRSCLYWS